MHPADDPLGSLTSWCYSFVNFKISQVEHSVHIALHSLRIINAEDSFYYVCLQVRSSIRLWADEKEGGG